MQPYDCPKCGAKEPGVHRDSCSLAGQPVWPGYNPPDWSKAEQLLERKLDDWRHQWPGRIVLIDAHSLDYKVVDSNKQAFDPDNPPFGFAPATGHAILVQRLMTDKELAEAKKKVALLSLA